MGQPVAGNPTQYMMQKAFEQAGLDWSYLTFEVPAEDFADAMRGFRAMGFRGANLTVPHQRAVIPLLDELTPAAELSGSVNCVSRVEDRLIGDNTDGRGFLHSLRDVSDPAGKRVVVLGAGSAARAIAVELALAQAAHLVIVNRTADRGESLAELIRSRTEAEAEFRLWEGEIAIEPETDVLVQATSVGFYEPRAMVAVEQETLHPDLVVADVIYHPPQTALLRAASSRGCTTLDGLGMLVHQGAIAFTNWTHAEPDRHAMREAVEEFLSA